MPQQRRQRSKGTEPSATVILIPKHLRMDWTDVLATDASLPPVSFKVAAAIGTHFDNKSGMTYVSQKTLAKVTGLGEATVGRAILDLERRGYIIIQRREIGERADGRKVYGGKGIANVYLPAVDAAQISATDRGQRLVSRVQKAWDETAPKHITHDVLNPAKHIAGDVLSETLSTSNQAPKHITHDVPTLSYPTGKNSSRARGPSSASALGPAGERIKRAIGDPAYRSWFGSVATVSVADGVVIMSAPTAFIRDRLMQDFDIAMLRAWQAVDPTVQRVTVVLAEAPQ